MRVRVCERERGRFVSRSISTESGIFHSHFPNGLYNGFDELAGKSESNFDK